MSAVKHKPLPPLQARVGTFHRQDVLNISKPAEGLRGGDVGLFWDQEIGREILRRANAYPKLVEALSALGKLAETTPRPTGMPDISRALLDISGISAAILRELGEDS